MSLRWEPGPAPDQAQVSHANADLQVTRPERGVERRVAVHPGSIPVSSHVTNLDLDVTENCNLGCVYCFKGEKTTRNMSTETARASVEWLLKASGPASSVNVNFMGGEPTMRWPLIRELVPWARRRGRRVGKRVTFSMTTNLTLWTDEIREFVDEYGFGVLMSIDGSPAVQEAQRGAKNGRSTIEQIERWARSMLRTRPRSTARATVTPEHVDRLRESVVYLHGLGFREIAISPSQYDGWHEEHFEALRRELEAVVAFTLDRRIQGESFNLTAFKYLISKLVQPRWESPRGVGAGIQRRPQPCGAGKGMMMVDDRGDIWPCHRFDGADADAGADGQFRLGNILEGGFRHDRQKAFLDFDHRVHRKASCDTCPVDPVCAGYCPAANIADTGSLYTPHDAFCRWSQMMYASAELLHSELTSRPDALARLLEESKDANSDGTK